MLNIGGASYILCAEERVTFCTIVPHSKSRPHPYWTIQLTVPTDEEKLVLGKVTSMLCFFKNCSLNFLDFLESLSIHSSSSGVHTTAPQNRQGPDPSWKKLIPSSDFILSFFLTTYSTYSTPAHLGTHNSPTPGAVVDQAVLESEALAGVPARQIHGHSRHPLLAH